MIFFSLPDDEAGVSAQLTVWLRDGQNTDADAVCAHHRRLLLFFKIQGGADRVVGANNESLLAVGSR